MFAQRLARSALFATLLAVVGLHASAGFRGVGFGDMWDESYQIEGLQHAVKTASPVPDGYYYGGLYYLPGFLLVAPVLLQHLPAILEEMRDQPSRPFKGAAYPSLVKAQEAAQELIEQPGFVKRDRKVFAAIVALTIVWVFIAAYSATGSRWAALAAASAIGLSWELSYHGRWIAVDSMLAQFGALTFAFVFTGLSASSAAKEKWLLRLASIGAGLGIGCKLPGVFLTVPVLIALGFSPYVRGLRAWLARALEAGLIALAVFIATTPGIVLDPFHFADDMFRVASEYNRIADTYPYCEASLALRVAKTLAYWGGALFSPCLPIALSFTAFVLVGVGCALKERHPKMLALLGFLVAYVGFVAMQRLVIVRNLMVTFPALAILAALGIQRTSWFLERMRFGRTAFAVAIVLALSWNAREMWEAAASVGTATHQAILASVSSYLRQNPPKDTYISPALLTALDEHGEVATAELAPADFGAAKYVMMYATGLPQRKANIPRFARYFASRHANYDYYPGLLTWDAVLEVGSPIVLISKSRLAELGVENAPPR